VSQLVLDKLKVRFGAAILETHSHFGDDTALVDAAEWKAIAQFLRHDPALDFDMPVDLCGVDYPNRLPRMEVVLHLYSVSKRHRVRLKTRVGDEDMDGAELDSLVSIWPGINWLEREVFDMSGVRFRGHPDLRRILMYPEFEGHPLQKTYAADRTQPLIPYRTEEEAGLPIHKIEPFGPDEGMPFGRSAPHPRWEDN
jgi:NADH-quinone oxidoreductase subunit C